jgi:hypothetical protein
MVSIQDTEWKAFPRFVTPVRSTLLFGRDRLRSCVETRHTKDGDEATLERQPSPTRSPALGKRLDDDGDRQSTGFSGRAHLPRNLGGTRGTRAPLSVHHMRAITVEGFSLEDESSLSDAATEIADLVRYRGTTEIASAPSVEVLQFKYSLTRHDVEMRAFDIKKTLQKFAEAG